MDALKLLIADDNEEFRQALAEALQDMYYIRTCRTGREALSLLRSFSPDVLVLNLMLPEMDGISLLENAVRSGIRPMVLATTPLDNDYVVESVSRLGVEYLMRRPCDVPSTVSRIRDLSRRLKPPLISRPDPMSHVSNLLLALGFATRLNGYALVREAILIKARNPDYAITKELYPAVAAACRCRKDHVERSIRSAINNAWKRRDDQVWQRYFHPEADGTIPRPTNGAFITRLADSLRLSQENMAQLTDSDGNNSGFGTY